MKVNPEYGQKNQTSKAVEVKRQLDKFSIKDAMNLNSEQLSLLTSQVEKAKGRILIMTHFNFMPPKSLYYNPPLAFDPDYIHKMSAVISNLKSQRYPAIFLHEYLNFGEIFGSYRFSENPDSKIDPKLPNIYFVLTRQSTPSPYVNHLEHLKTETRKLTDDDQDNLLWNRLSKTLKKVGVKECLITGRYYNERRAVALSKSENILMDHLGATYRNLPYGCVGATAVHLFAEGLDVVITSAVSDDQPAKVFRRLTHKEQ